jgi:hypothetical protein
MTVKNLKNFVFADVVSVFDGRTTELIVAAGQGARFPDEVPFGLLLFDDLERFRGSAAEAFWAGEAEILSCTAITDDTLTVTRGGEGGASARTSLAGHRYRLLLDDTEAEEEEPPE